MDEKQEDCVIGSEEPPRVSSVTFGDNTYEEPPQFDKFKVDIDVLMNFIFDPSLQWPLAAGRLFAFALYGPLDKNGNLCTGPKGSHIVSIWELDSMCTQIEKEDMLQIYLHRGRDMPLLTNEEQEAIIGQADAHLKRAKGKAMLPSLTKEAVLGILEDIPCCSSNPGSFSKHISFHDAQREIMLYREERIKQYKLVYPSLTKKKKDTSSFSTLTATGSNVLEGSSVSDASSLKSSIKSRTAKKKGSQQGLVSESVAPKTMFLRLKGASNSDIIETSNKYLHSHAYKISTLDTANLPSMTANVRLLREIVPVCSDPYIDKKTGRSKREPWNDTCNMKGTRVGSLVKCAASTSTYKRNTTAY